MSSTVVKAPTSRARLGHARVEITPPVGIYHRMWGAARHDRATGVHRPLLADVVALAPLVDSGEIRSPQPVEHVRAFLDLVGLAQRQHEALVQALAGAVGVPADRVVVTHSHTHAAGWLVPDRIALPGGELIPPYLEDLAARLAGAGRRAVAQMQEVTITYAQGTCRMAASRDYWDAARGAYSCGFNPDAPSIADDPARGADDTLLLARASDQDGAHVATLVNYACHPTTLAWQNTLLSPDFPGALRETVEQATGAPCIFAQGACGDLGPRRGFTGDTAVADRNGQQVGFAALAALAAHGPPATDYHYAGAIVSGATLGVWEDRPFDAARATATARFQQEIFTVDLPLKPLPDRSQVQAELADWEARQRAAAEQGDAEGAASAAGAARDYGALAERARRWLARLEDIPRSLGGASGAAAAVYPLHVTVLRLGDAVWVTTGGEPYSAIQVALRRRFPGLAILFSPLGGDMQVAYLLRRECYGRGLYQEEPSMLAPGCLERLTDAIAARIEGLLAS